MKLLQILAQVMSGSVIAWRDLLVLVRDSSTLAER